MLLGCFGVLFSYGIGLPIGMLMARFKDGLFDKVSMATMTFMLALPSIALIYVIRFAGSQLTGLPDSFPNLRGFGYSVLYFASTNFGDI